MMLSNVGKVEMDSSESSIRISHSSRIIAKVVPSFLQRAFSDPSLEHLYQSYRVKQKRVDILCFLYASLLFDIYSLSSWAAVASTVDEHSTPQSEPTDVLLPLLLALLTVFNAALLLALSLPPTERLAKVMEVVWTVAPHAAWHAATGQLIATLLLAKHAYVTPRESLGWVLILDYLIYVTLPLRLRYCLTLSLVTCVSYLTVVGCRHEDNLGQQVGANCALLLATNVLGLTSYFLSDKQQRRAFLETRQSLEVKLLIEEQSAEQERLLLSVLPEHVAVKMRQDLGEAIDSQFKKIYMSRHENVSILYADIVGFTAISSTYSASELVKILNELFARFDRLAEKYQQLRIKILGDCYYCISGAPKERPDHAILCVHMGLSMVEAIKYVQNTTNSPVDMRVGIHTGAVLAGVLGQRQWQFDVYSKDVELANKMESSGMKGRVHISEKTLGYLDGHFEVEPAHGEKREEALRLAGIKTFFIVRALKPFEGNISETRNGGTDFGTDEATANGDSCYKEDSMTIQVYNDSSNRVRENSQDFKRRLRQDLLSRDGHRDVARHIRMLGLGFADPAREKAYHSHKASFPAASTLGCPLAALALWLAQTAVLPWHVGNYIAFALGFIILAAFATVAVADTFSNKFPPSLVKWSAKLNGTLWMRTVAGAIAILILMLLNIINMAVCSFKPYENCTYHDHEEITPSMSLDWEEWQSVKETPSLTLCTITACLYPSYYSSFVVVILVTTSLMALLSHTAKLAIMCAVIILQIGMNFGPLRTRIGCERLASYQIHDIRPIPDDIALTCLLVSVVIALHFLNRHVEKASRVLFVWRMEVEEQREKAADMRRRNESLVYNILPPHVAAHFLRPGAPRRHDELYSQSYAEVGVLFASMPNFSDFYTEETVNNQGLECLRFLNEVISDYDALLERPEFQDIIKIKTIGSTYMAASGLKPKPDGPAEESDVVAGTPGPTRWAHLALLVEFAFELKRALTSINEQSFNHFVLKMGINHGPITAGVIGARKPHYDIWGNSVNVASRMESTGKAGCIQVTEETCGILRPFGYQFEQRGLVSVKGKGQLMTYYLIGKGDPPPPEENSLSTDQISADVAGDDDATECMLKNAISGNSATQLLASSLDE